jgi:hypothetical protein
MRIESCLSSCDVAVRQLQFSRNEPQRRWCTMRPMREPVMLKEVARGGGGGRPPACNVLGERLEVCSLKPMTGFNRDGCCDTSCEDVGSHTVCAVMTTEFLAFRNPAATISRLRFASSVFRAWCPAIAGAFARHAGTRHSRRAKRRGWYCGRPTRVPLPIAR